MQKTTEYKNGFDCGKNGANETNCHFSNFSTEEKKNEWQKGQKAGVRAKERKERQPLIIGGVEYGGIEFKNPFERGTFEKDGLLITSTDNGVTISNTLAKNSTIVLGPDIYPGK